MEKRQWHPAPVLLPGKSHGWRSQEGCSPWGHWGSDRTERLPFHFSLSCIGEGNGNPLQCSSWRIPGTGEPGGLPSTGSHRVRHDWSDLAVAHVDSKIWYKWTYLWNRNRLTDIESRLCDYQEGKSGAGIDWELMISRCKLWWYIEKNVYIWRKGKVDGRKGKVKGRKGKDNSSQACRESGSLCVMDRFLIWCNCHRKQYKASSKN